MLKPLMLAILLVLAAGVGAYFYSSRSQPVESPTPSVSASPSPSPTPIASPSPQADDSRQVMEFTMAGYMNAVKTDKLVVLYFYANWCPICRAGFPEFQEAIAELDSDRVVAFRVNYNDSETTDEEKTAAKTFQVGSQHTLVIVKSGEMAAKTDVSGWQSVMFKSTIEEHLRK